MGISLRCKYTTWSSHLPLFGGIDYRNPSLREEEALPVGGYFACGLLSGVPNFGYIFCDFTQL